MNKEQNKDWADDLPDTLLEELELAIQEADSETDSCIANAKILFKHRKNE